MNFYFRKAGRTSGFFREICVLYMLVSGGTDCCFGVVCLAGNGVPRQAGRYARNQGHPRTAQGRATATQHREPSISKGKSTGHTPHVSMGKTHLESRLRQSRYRGHVCMISCMDANDLEGPDSDRRPEGSGGPVATLP